MHLLQVGRYGKHGPILKLVLKMLNYMTCNKLHINLINHVICNFEVPRHL